MQKMDAVVTIGTYIAKDGQEKKLFEKVGQFIISDDGRISVSLKKSFNPAGCPSKDNSVWINAMPEKAEQPTRQAKRPAPDFNDDIPF